MKRFFQIAGIALFITLFADLRNPAAAQPGGNVSYQDFYDELSPYGRWIDYPDYGYVWCPDEGRDFRPYSTNGRWVWSDDLEWMWVSDYSWGWAPFHYGRWFYDELYGWMWVPGYDWSPAWVAWRGGGEYYGWAPLRPGINISIGFSIGSYAPPVNYWCFAPSRYITSPRIYDYCVSPRQNVTIINNTTIINNYNYNRNVFVTGPRRNDVERFTNQRISSVRVREISSPGRSGFRNNEVALYRPGIQRDNSRNFAPRHFDNYRRGSDNSVARERFNRPDDRNGIRDRAARNDNPRQFEQRRDNNDFRRENSRIERRVQPNQEQARPNNNIRERSARDVFGRDNRPGIDQPVRQNRFERRSEPQRQQEQPRRFEAQRQQEQPRRIESQRQQEQPRRIESQRQQEQPRRFEAQRQQEQPRRVEPQRQQEQPRRFEPQRQQEQPRRFENQQGGNNGDNNHGRFNRGRKG